MVSNITSKFHLPALGLSVGKNGKRLPTSNQNEETKKKRKKKTPNDFVDSVGCI